jgi:tripartite-type tricarboxylate transporter receptor subunit TctC
MERIPKLSRRNYESHRGFSAGALLVARRVAGIPGEAGAFHLALPAGRGGGHRTGGQGTVAANHVARSPADGYTYLFATVSNFCKPRTATPSCRTTGRDFTPVLAVIEKANLDMNLVLKMPEVRERLNALGSEPAGSTPEEMMARMRTESTQFARIVYRIGLKLD